MTSTGDGPAPHRRADRLARRQAEHAAQHAAAHEKQTSRNKRGALDRVLALVDEGTFVESGAMVQHRAEAFGLAKSRPLGDGVVTGFGEIDGRRVAIFSQDFTAFGGSLGEAYAEKMVRLMDAAARYGCPVIGINDSAGARIQEGVEGLAGYGDVFFRNVRLSGVVPQISVIAGPCAGGAVYSPAMTDFILMVRGTSQMFITGPDVIRTVTGETVTQEELGGADTHARRTGVAHFEADDEDELFWQVRTLLSYLPSNNLDEPPVYATEPDDHDRPALDGIVPEEANRPYDMHDVLGEVLDPDSFMEVQSGHATNIIAGLARLDGQVVGVVANQPSVLAGTLDIDASIKGARFIRFCDAFNLPLVSFVDVPGFLPGTDQEFGGIIRHGSKLLYAYAEATVPKMTVITRKAYGGAYVVMCSKHLGADLNLAWPQAEIAVMGPEAAVGLLFRRELAEADDPVDRRRELVGQYEELFSSPWQAAARGYIDAVIPPRDTRRRLIDALDLARTKREAGPSRKHGNIPL
ncbi:MAG TPA: acyl-CoA carboxylase subunit beta [Thermomicrobiales bacterium]|nr:acyl-CoA carboxylase subunit beta [Thermomicrobiales bacterium]